MESNKLPTAPAKIRHNDNKKEFEFIQYAMLFHVEQGECFCFCDVHTTTLKQELDYVKNFFTKLGKPYSHPHLHVHHYKPNSS